jgi:hypothetical protein
MSRQAQQAQEQRGTMYDVTPEPLGGVPGARQSELPEGWREAERDDWADARAPSRRRGLALRVAAVAAVVVAVVGVLVWVAAGHYARGVEALRAQAYSRAMGEFAAARILVLPYRDAQALEEQARSALQAEAAAQLAEEERMAAVVSRLERAAARLSAGDTAGVLAALGAVSPGDLRAATAAGAPAAAPADDLTADLTAAAQEALQGAQWIRAGRFAAALLVLEPGSEQASSLAARARTGERLRAQLAEAEAAARRGEWRMALRLALAVVAVRKEFPGAAALVDEARVALAPKPKPTPTPTPAVVAPPDTGGTTQPPPPPQPPPP